MKSVPNDEKSKTFFYLPNHKHRELFDDLRKNITGGASIIFKRRAEKGMTLIRENESLCAPHETVQSCQGVDCNALYTFCLGGECLHLFRLYVEKRTVSRLSLLVQWM